MVQRRETADLLHWALAQLSPENRMVLTLVYLEGYTVRDAAALLGWSTVNVKVRAHRARRQLRKSWRDEEEHCVKRRSREQTDWLLQTLKEGHARRDVPHLSPLWRESVMQVIRRQPTGLIPSSEAPQLIWRAAAVVAILSALLVGSVLTLNASLVDADSSAMFAEASLDPTLFGGEP